MHALCLIRCLLPRPHLTDRHPSDGCVPSPDLLQCCHMLAWLCLPTMYDLWYPRSWLSCWSLWKAACLTASRRSESALSPPGNAANAGAAGLACPRLSVQRLTDACMHVCARVLACAQRPAGADADRMRNRHRRWHGVPPGAWMCAVRSRLGRALAATHLWHQQRVQLRSCH